MKGSEFHPEAAGSQQPQMLRDLVRHSAVDETLSEVSAVLDLDVRSLDSPEALQSALSVQLAILTQASPPQEHFNRADLHRSLSQVCRSEHSRRQLPQTRYLSRMQCVSRVRGRSKWSSCIRLDLASLRSLD